MTTAHSDDRKSGRPPIPVFVRLLVVVGLAFGLYQGVMALVRLHVDDRIAEPVGAAVIDFELPDTDGGRWRAAELRGRWVLLNFFRSQCAGCLAERDAVKRLAARLDPEQASLLGVLVDRVQGYDAATTQRTLERMDYAHPVLIADEEFVDAFHGAGWSNVTPITYVVDPQGVVVDAARGHQTYAQLAALLPAGALGDG